MPFDFKKENPRHYSLSPNPALIYIPNRHFFMCDTKGDPNNSPDFQVAVEMLYGLSYTIKMSKMGDYQPPGYFDYVVPPLEGLWSVDDDSYHGGGVALEDKSKLYGTLMLRQPDFVTEGTFMWAKGMLCFKRPDLAKTIKRVRLEPYYEGYCVQAMHTGSFDTEAETVHKITQFIEGMRYTPNFNSSHRHHEIYLSDPRKTEPSKLKTIIRHPVLLPT